MNLEDVRRLYDRWAPFYNPTHRWSLPKRRAARLALELKPGDRVLDLACGTGLNFPHLRDMVGETGAVVGADLSPRMLAVARNLIGTEGWKNVEAREEDAAHLPFADGFFDSALCTFALNVIPDYRSALKEVRRVLKPGGRFVSLEMRSFAHMSAVARLCGVDPHRDVLEAIKMVFKEVRVAYYWKRMFFVATANK